MIDPETKDIYLIDFGLSVFIQDLTEFTNGTIEDAFEAERNMLEFTFGNEADYVDINIENGVVTFQIDE